MINTNERLCRSYAFRKINIINLKITFHFLLTNKLYWSLKQMINPLKSLKSVAKSTKIEPRPNIGSDWNQLRTTFKTFSFSGSVMLRKVLIILYLRSSWNSATKALTLDSMILHHTFNIFKVYFGFHFIYCCFFKIGVLLDRRKVLGRHCKSLWMIGGTM